MTRTDLVTRIDGHEIAITRPGKILFPQDGITKAELIHYYERIAPLLLPHLVERPLVMQRFPDGINRPGFIQKAAARYYPAWIRKVTVPKRGGLVKHVVCDDAATLVYLANQACITLHPWLSRTSEIHSPDQMVFDFDPSREDDFAGVVGGALAIKDVLDELELPAYVKTTGSRGLHVVVPLDGRQNFDAVRDFARRLATIIIDRDSDRYTLEQRKNNRGDRVLIDVNRNGYAQTAVAAYSVRARPGAPVSMPVHWTELREKNFRSDAFTIRNVFERHDTTAWKDFRSRAVSLEAASRKFRKPA